MKTLVVLYEIYVATLQGEFGGMMHAQPVMPQTLDACAALAYAIAWSINLDYAELPGGMIYSVKCMTADAAIAELHEFDRRSPDKTDL